LPRAAVAIVPARGHEEGDVSTHEINIDTPVHSSDGKKLGNVHRLVVDAANQRLAYLMIHKGIFGHEKLVDVDLVASSDAHGVTLSVTEEQAKELPEYVEKEFFQTRGSVSFSGPGMFGGTVPIQGGGNQWIMYGPNAGDYPHAGGDSLFMQAPIGTVVTEVVSSIPDGDLVINEGTEVLDSIGHKVGRVDELLFDDENRITGFVAKAGHIFKHDVRIPIDQVAGITHDHVRLKVTKDAIAEGGQASG
jgi:uncharacterized protein YrrD